MSQSREELLHNAVLFLTDQKVHNSSLASKITFLEGKGLNEDEIEEALRRARTGNTEPVPVAGPSRAYSTPQGQGYGYEQGFMQRMPPEVPKRDWRDLFVGRYKKWGEGCQLILGR
jgi:peroxin-14